MDDNGQNQLDSLSFIRAAQKHGEAFVNDVRGWEDDEALSECFTSLRMPTPQSLGHLLMANLLGPLEASPDTFTGDEKAFWAAVAATMGPDWIDKLRVVAAFMDTVDGFKARV